MDTLNYILKTRYNNCTNEEPALHQAVISNDLETLKLFLRCGFDINITDKYDRLPIAYVLKNSQLEILDLLLAGGSNIYQIKKNGKMQFASAFRSGHVDVIKKYLEHQMDLNMIDFFGQTAIHYLMDNDCYEISDILKELDFNVDSENVFGLTPMLLAVKKRDLNWVKLLLDKGANPNYESYRHRTNLYALISSRCNHPSSFRKNSEGKYTFHCSGCIVSSLRCMELLVENGAEINKTFSNDNFCILRIVLYFHDFQLATPILKKLAIIEASGTPLININRITIEQYPMAKLYYSNVKTELKSMMELELKNHTKVSYFEILVEEDLNTLANYFRNSKCREDFEKNLNCFPYYSKNLKRKFIEGVKREEEISRKEKMLSYLNIPPRLIRKIAAHCLSDNMNSIK